MLGHRPYVFPILLPFTSFVSAGFVPCIPIPHEKSGNIVTLLPATQLRNYRRKSGHRKHRTWSTINLAVTEESTPPDMATTTKPRCFSIRNLLIISSLPFSPLSGCSFHLAFIARRRLVKLRIGGRGGKRNMSGWAKATKGGQDAIECGLDP